MFKERKLNIDAADYEKNIDANLYKPSEKKSPTSIKDTIEWFPFLTIRENTANIVKTNKRMITSLLRAFAMYEFRLIGHKNKLDVIAIRCINYKKTGFIFTKFDI